MVHYPINDIKIYMTDSTGYLSKDKTTRVMEVMEEWRDRRIKGSIILHYDGSGRIARFQLTYDGC